MILNEKRLFDAVAEKFGIENNDCGFSAKVLTLVCLKECGSFVEDDTYTLWFGSLLVKGVRKFFTCKIDGAVEEVVEEAFKIKKEPLGFMHTDGSLYSVIYNFSGICQIIPCWRLDLLKVKQNACFSAKYDLISGKFEHVSTGDENFFAWVFYVNGTVLRIFNIETGEWLEPQKAIAHLTLTGNQVLKNVRLTYEHDFILCSRVVNLSV